MDVGRHDSSVWRRTSTWFNEVTDRQCRRLVTVVMVVVLVAVMMRSFVDQWKGEGLTLCLLCGNRTPAAVEYEEMAKRQKGREMAPNGRGIKAQEQLSPSRDLKQQQVQLRKRRDRSVPSKFLLLLLSLLLLLLLLLLQLQLPLLSTYWYLRRGTTLNSTTTSYRCHNELHCTT